MYESSINEKLTRYWVTCHFKGLNTPIDLVNNTVLSESTNDKGEITKLRVCLDPHDLNKDVFQKQLDSALKDLSGVTGIADDTFTIGSTEQEH